MRTSTSPRSPWVLLVAGLWAAAAAGQTWTAQPADEPGVGAPEAAQREPVRPVVSPPEASPPLVRSQIRCTVRVRSLQSPATRQFSATEILDLDIYTQLRPVPEGEHTLRLEIETPRGHLFQTLTIPFTNEPPRPGTRRAIDGFPGPVEVRLAEPNGRRGGRAASIVAGRLPVAGTPIVHGSLYGRWRARAYLDDEIESCGRPRTFFLEP